MQQTDKFIPLCLGTGVPCLSVQDLHLKTFSSYETSLSGINKLEATPPELNCAYGIKRPQQSHFKSYFPILIFISPTLGCGFYIFAVIDRWPLCPGSVSPIVLTPTFNLIGMNVLAGFSVIKPLFAFLLYMLRQVHKLSKDNYLPDLSPNLYCTTIPNKSIVYIKAILNRF